MQLGSNPDSTPAAPPLKTCPGWSQRGNDPLKGERTTWIGNELWYCCLAFWVCAAKTGGKNPEVDPGFLERSYLGLNVAVCTGGALSCVHRWNATQHPSLLSVVLWMSNPEALTPTALLIPPLYAPYPTWPSSLKQQPWPTWLTEPPAWGLCAPNEPYNNVTSNVKARVISVCVCVCVCLCWGCGAWCWGVSCVAATASRPSLSVIKCINV